jgi:Domain of unknown function (DUF4440)
MRVTQFRTAALALLLLVGCTGTSAESGADPDAQLEDPANGAQFQDPALLESILEDIRVGWEQGNGDSFYEHFLDWEGARYFEGGGQNVGLKDLVENHVEPEGEAGLSLGFSNIQTHFEGDFAWAVVDTEIEVTTSGGQEIHNMGHGTYLFRLVDGVWKVVHTQSASRPAR